MTTTTCTVGPLATTGTRCGKPAVTTFGEFAECGEHAFRIERHVVAKVATPRYCRKVACVEAALGFEFVAHLAGTCR